MVRLHTETVILAPIERCFDLARSVDVHTASACLIHGKAIGGRTAGLAALGDSTTWSARFFGMRFSLTTEIMEFDRPYRFSDVQCADLFTHFGHVYTFESRGPRQTVMVDEFTFQSPLGLVGSLFDRIVLCRRMQAVLEFRADFIKRVAESDEWRVYLTNAAEQEAVP